MAITLHIYNEIDHDVRDRWLKLWEENGDAHPFNHPTWFTVAQVKSKDSSRVVVVASKKDRDLMFLSGEACKKKLRLLGSPYLEKSSILLHPATSKRELKEIIESLLKEYHQITFQEAAQSLGKILDIETRHAWRLSRFSSTSPLFEVEDPQLNAKRRHEIRRYTRKLDKEHGPLAIEFSPLNVQLLQMMADIEKRSTKPSRGRAEFENETYFNFLKDMMDQYEGMCWIGVMTLSEKPVAHYTGIVYKNNILGLHMAFDRKFSRYSPGSVLIFNLLPFLSEKNISVFEFGRGQSVVKSRFSGEQMDLQDNLYFFKRNFLGVMGLLQTRLLWSGISLGRWIRKKNYRTVNRVLDRLALKR